MWCLLLLLTIMAPTTCVFAAKRDTATMGADWARLVSLPVILLPAGLLLESFLPGWLRAIESDRLMPRIRMLQGPAASTDNLRIHLAEKCLFVFLGMAMICLFGLLGDAAPGFALFIPAGGMAMWLVSDRQLSIAHRERCGRMEREFPEFVCQIALLTGAGLQVRQALSRVARETGAQTTMICREVSTVLANLEGGMPETQAWSELAERCRIREITTLCGLFIQQARLGSAGLARELRQMASDSWEARKHAAKRLGEEASSRLMLPVSILFVAVLIVSVAPAFLSMSGMF